MSASATGVGGLLRSGTVTLVRLDASARGGTGGLEWSWARTEFSQSMEL